jgi:hypothetical protein
MAMRHWPTDDHDLEVPWDIVDDHLHDDRDAEQHKRRRGQKLRKRSIRHYRHATKKMGRCIGRVYALVDWLQTQPISFSTRLTALSLR